VLGDHGIFGSEYDSKEFANNLMELIGDELSLRDLEHLRDAIDLKINCKKSGIELDLNRVYHNENEKLFTNYFDKPDVL